MESYPIKDDLTPRTEYNISIKDSTGEHVWEKPWLEWKTESAKLDLISPTKPIVDRRLENFSESEKEAIRTIPLSFQVIVDPIENETETENNQLSFSIDASRRKKSIIDSG